MNYFNQKTMIGTAVLLVAILCFYSFSPTRSNTGVVHLTALFQSFAGTLEMEAKIKQDLNRPHVLLDSLNNHLEYLNKTDKDNKVLIESTITKRNLLSEHLQVELTKLNKEYTDKIWSQINSYVQEYAVEKDLDYLYGLDGSGNIMYAKESSNRTADILKYINDRYHGK